MVTLSNRISACALVNWALPVSFSECSSISANTPSAAANPFCKFALISAKCFSGLNISNMAVMKDTKSPMVAVPSRVCMSAIVTTTDTPIAPIS